MVQRETQTVRAVEPRSGQEKWNFSVSTHSIEVERGVEDLCDNSDAIDDYDDEVVTYIVTICDCLWPFFDHRRREDD